MPRRIGTIAEPTVVAAPGVFSLAEVEALHRRNRWPRGWQPWTGTWNPADKDTGITLSNSDLSWTPSGLGGSSAAVRGTVSRSTGLWRYTVANPSIVGAGTTLLFGLATATAGLTTWPGNDAQGIALSLTDTAAGKVVIYHDSVPVGCLPRGTAYSVLADLERGHVFFATDTTDQAVFDLSDLGLSGATLYPIAGYIASSNNRTGTANFAGPF